MRRRGGIAVCGGEGDAGHDDIHGGSDLLGVSPPQLELIAAVEVGARRVGHSLAANAAATSIHRRRLVRTRRDRAPWSAPASLMGPEL